MCDILALPYWCGNALKLYGIMRHCCKRAIIIKLGCETLDVQIIVSEESLATLLQNVLVHRLSSAVMNMWHKRTQQ